MTIKYGDIEYFTLLDLQDKLRSYDYNRLPLEYFDKLRLEVDLLVEAIHLEYKEKKSYYGSEWEELDREQEDMTNSQMQ